MEHSIISTTISLINHLPLMSQANHLLSHTTKTLHKACQKDDTRFAAVAVATMMTAGCIWGLQFLSKMPFIFPCIKKAFFSTFQIAFYSGLTWVIFIALNSVKNQPQQLQSHNHSLPFEDV